jgi:hypothetical protein
MNLKKFILAISCHLPLFGFCQNDYIVKNNGDTIRGEISVRDKKFIVNGPVDHEISPDEISRISSEKYKGNTAVRCNLIWYIDNLAELELNFILTGIADTVLVLDEIYSTPKMNLYYVQSDLKTPYYFYKTPSDAKPVQLVTRYHLDGGLSNFQNNPIRYRGQVTRVHVIEDKGYVNQLYAIMRSCRKISPSMWELLTYRDYSLKKLIRKYNQCN